MKKTVWFLLVSIFLLWLSGCKDFNNLDPPVLVPGIPNRYEENLTITQTGEGHQEWFTKITHPDTNTLRLHVSVNQGQATEFYIHYRKKGEIPPVKYYERFVPGEWTKTFAITGLPRGEYRLYVDIFSSGHDPISATIHWWEEEYSIDEEDSI